MFRFTIRELVTLVVTNHVLFLIFAATSLAADGNRLAYLDGPLGVNLETLLSGLEANPSAISVTINPRPARTITSVKVPKAYRGTMPFAGSSDYQAPPRPPLRISDEERP
jgi:hypothetical protein